jgi:hypothetical protein
MVLQFGIEKVLEFVNNLYKIIIMFVFVYLFFIRPIGLDIIVINCPKNTNTTAKL